MSAAGAVSVAGELASALDAEDYAAARALLDDGCTYEIRGRQIVGAEAIVASYRANAESGHRQFDEVRFESSVTGVTATEARIDYTDYLRCAGEELVHRCAQRVAVDGRGRVVAITHVDLPGERARLDAFKERHASPGR